MDDNSNSVQTIMNDNASPHMVGFNSMISRGPNPGPLWFQSKDLPAEAAGPSPSYPLVTTLIYRNTPP
ncbi:hypothetical protein RRG08_055073 [Elysia crispata]|uniref:Uncharacterized protein n=1 Tax=Elysia crispata TaxID=231223 RepID=A0AAE1AZX9_9GAST|nr:hypothetical protein RRG08_055073 [Elysia crispata]